MIGVTGATGALGGRVARHLADRGVGQRLIVRDRSRAPSLPGAEVAEAPDYADGDAVVLLEDGHLGQVYEFGGDVAWDYSELAAAAAEVVGRPVEYQRLTTAEHVAALEAVGLDSGTAAFVAGIDDASRRGVLGDTDGTLSRLIGRPTTPLVDGLRAAVPAPEQTAA